MKSIASLCAFLLLSSFAIAAEIHQDFQVEAGKTLNINLRTGGDIHIQGWNKPVVSINGYVRGRDREDTELRAEQTAQGVYLKSRYTGDRENYTSKSEFEISIPDRFNVQIESMGGEVTIQNVEGEFDG